MLRPTPGGGGKMGNIKKKASQVQTDICDSEQNGVKDDNY